jgi:hypothetical protein
MYLVSSLQSLKIPLESFSNLFFLLNNVCEGSFHPAEVEGAGDKKE